MRVLLALAIIAPVLLHTWTGIHELPALWLSAVALVVIYEIDQKVVGWIRQLRASTSMRRR